MLKINQISKLAIILLVCFLVSGCSADPIKNKINWLDDKIGEIFKSFQLEKTDEVVNIMEKDENINASDLTQEQKDQIDKWLSENNFNRYGDPEGTMYTGGTPLFDEETGESIERFEYILEKQPVILNFIN